MGLQSLQPSTPFGWGVPQAMGHTERKRNLYRTLDACQPYLLDWFAVEDGHP